MKKYLFIVFLVGVCFGQDVSVLNDFGWVNRVSNHDQFHPYLSFNDYHFYKLERSSWDNDNNDWKIVERTNFTRNDIGLYTEYILEFSDDGVNFYNSRKRENIYDEYGNITLEKGVLWDNNTNDWIIYDGSGYYYEYHSPELGLLSRGEFYSDSLTLEERQTYGYDLNNSLILFTYCQQDDFPVIYNDSLFYDENGRPLKRVIYANIFNGELLTTDCDDIENMVLSQMQSFIYDDDSLIDTVNWVYFGVDTSRNRYINVRNTDNQIIEQTHYGYYSDTGYYPSYKYNSEYENGLLINHELYNWQNDSSDWLQKYRWHYGYSDDGQLILRQVYKYDSDSQSLYLRNKQDGVWDFENNTYTLIRQSTSDLGATYYNDFKEIYYFDQLSINSQTPPANFSLLNAYPNPFNPTTTINFSLKTDNKIKISVYDLNGREISSLLNQKISSGNYSIIWNARNQPSGVYFIRLEGKEFYDIKKVMLLK